MSATLVSACTTVRAKARCVTVVSNELLNIGLRITEHYGLSKGSFTVELEPILHGLRVWLAAHQLESVVIEVFDKRGKLARKWEFAVDYSESEQDEDQYETRLEELEAFLEEDRPKGLSRYRVLVNFRTESPIQVPGWKTAQATDDAHLVRREVSTGIVGTRHLRVHAVVFCDVPSNSGEPV